MCSQESQINKITKIAAKIIHLLILGVYVHVCARYEVSVIKLVARRDNDDANPQWTINDYIGSSVFMHFANKFLYQKC